MIYRRLDDNHDYTMGGNKQNFLSDRAAVAQAVVTKLNLLYAEWWEDTENGLPLFKQILSTRMTESGLQVVENLIRDRIQSTLHVTSATNFTSTFDKAARTYTFSCDIETTYGVVNLTDMEVSV